MFVALIFRGTLILLVQIKDSLRVYSWLNPSCTKPFGTHTLYQVGGGGSAGSPAISKTVDPMNLEFVGH